MVTRSGAVGKGGGRVGGSSCVGDLGVGVSGFTRGKVDRSDRSGEVV